MLLPERTNLLSFSAFSPSSSDPPRQLPNHLMSELETEVNTTSASGGEVARDDQLAEQFVSL